MVNISEIALTDRISSDFMLVCDKLAFSYIHSDECKVLASSQVIRKDCLDVICNEYAVLLNELDTDKEPMRILFKIALKGVAMSVLVERLFFENIIEPNDIIVTHRKPSAFCSFVWQLHAPCYKVMGLDERISIARASMHQIVLTVTSRDKNKLRNALSSITEAAIMNYLVIHYNAIKGV